MEMISETDMKKQVEDKGWFSQSVPVPCGGPCSGQIPFLLSLHHQVSQFFTFLFSFSIDRLFLAWSPVSQWLQHWAFPLFVPFFFSSFESLENAGQWLTGILECLATQGLCRRKWAVSVCGSVSMATKIKNEKKAPAQSCWDVLEMRNSLSTFSLMACGSTAQGPAALALMLSSSQWLSPRLQFEITAPLQHILAWLREVALLTDHSFKAFYVSMGSRWWSWLTGSEYQLYL